MTRGMPGAVPVDIQPITPAIGDAQRVMHRTTLKGSETIAACSPQLSVDEPQPGRMLNAVAG